MIQGVDRGLLEAACKMQVFLSWKGLSDDLEQLKDEELTCTKHKWLDQAHRQLAGGRTMTADS